MLQYALAFGPGIVLPTAVIMFMVARRTVVDRDDVSIGKILQLVMVVCAVWAAGMMITENDWNGISELRPLPIIKTAANFVLSCVVSHVAFAITTGIRRQMG